MSHFRLRNFVAPGRRLALLVSTACLVAIAPIACGSDSWDDIWAHPHEQVGHLNCTSATCHGRTSPRFASADPTGQEYWHWFNDPHAAAGRRMSEPRFQEVLRKASNLPEGKTDPVVYAQCAKCHDPLGSIESQRSAADSPSLSLSPSNTALSLNRGIGCETCHGGAKDWLVEHFRNGYSRQDLLQRGMIDTKNLLVRARLCASCHVGSVSQDMNHDMIAAGHPPLRFELASHQAIIDKKHWNDSPRRRAEPDYEVQLWAAGRIASADAALSLLEGRAQRKIAAEKNPAATMSRVPWPEFASHNCFACHHSLRPYDGTAAAGQTGPRSRGLPWQTWDVLLADRLLAGPQLKSDDLPSPEAMFPNRLKLISLEMEKSLSPSAAQVADLAAQARALLRQKTRVNDRGTLLAHDDSPISVADVAEILAARPTVSPPTWDALCQELAAILAAERSIRDGAAKADEPAFVAARPDQMQPDAGASLRARTRRVADSLRFTSAEFERPAATGKWLPRPSSAAGTMTLAEVAAEIAALTIELNRILATDDSASTN